MLPSGLVFALEAPIKGVPCRVIRAQGEVDHDPAGLACENRCLGPKPLAAGTRFSLGHATLPRPDCQPNIIYGTVSDPTGAAVPEASVTAVDIATGIATKTTTDVTGNYTLPSLPPGTYNVTVEKTGFKSTVISGSTLLVNQKARVDAQLEVGEVNTSVEVSGAAPLVETSTASIGTVIGQQQAVELPLNLRRIGAIATLVPGTTPDNGGFASQEFGSPFSETTYSANGTKTASNSFLIDGVESQSMTFGGFGVQPPPDAVQEFKIQTNIYHAAFGRYAGSTINLATKSGTNALHGTAYEFLRNDKLDARNFFASNQTNPVTGAEIPGSARPEFRRNQFGFALGGPIRKNKTFWFGNYEALREIKGLSLSSLIPTDAEKAGDFSSFLAGQMINLCSASGSAAPVNLNFDSGQLFDPASESLLTCPQNPATPSVAPPTVLIGTPIPGNKIATIDPVAQKVLPFFPEPNRPGFPNFVNQEPRVRNDHQFVVRIDHNMSSKDQIFGRYIFGQSNIKDTTLAFTTLPGFGDIIYCRGQNVALSWTIRLGRIYLTRPASASSATLTSQTANIARGARTSQRVLVSNPCTPFSAAQEDFPWFGLVNFAGIGDSNYRPVASNDMVEKYQDNLTWTGGRHTVVVGADLPFWQTLGTQAVFSQAGFPMTVDTLRWRVRFQA